MTPNISCRASLGFDIMDLAAIHPDQAAVLYADPRLIPLVQSSFRNVICQPIPQELIAARKPLTQDQMQAWNTDAVSLKEHAEKNGRSALGKEVYLKAPEELVEAYGAQISALCTPAYEGERVQVVAVNYAKQITDQGAKEGLSDEERRQLARAQSMSLDSIVEGVQQAEHRLPNTRFVLINTQYTAPNINAAEEIERVKAETGRDVVNLVYPHGYEKAGQPVDQSNDFLHQAAIYSAVAQLDGSKIGTADTSHHLAMSQLTPQLALVNVPVEESQRGQSVWPAFANENFPTVKVYEQDTPGDWSGASEAIANYLVSRYATR
jgi:hypothetical protein